MSKIITKEMLKSDLNNAYIAIGNQSREIERQADVIKELEGHINELESGACSCCVEDWKHKMLVKLNKENIILKERDTKARNILKPILNEWKETRWVLQSTKSVENIAELMADAEIFLSEVGKTI